MTKPLDDYNSSDSPTFGSLIHRGPDGYWKPIYPHEIGRALKHIEADYNYKLLSTSIANYRIYPAGQLPSNHPTPEDFTGNEGKFLTLKKEGTNFYWTLEEVSTDGGGAGDQIYNSLLDPNIEMVEGHGGLEEGTTVGDLSDGVTTLSELMDKILFPTAYPEIDPAASTSLNDGRQYAWIGETLNLTLTTGADRGLIKLNGDTQNNSAGDVSAALITGPGGPYTMGVTPPTGIDDLTISHVAVLGTSGNTWELKTTFLDGPMPVDSTGVDFPDIKFNLQDITASASFEGVYPIYLGTDAGNSSFTQRALISHSANNIVCQQVYSESSPALWHRISIPNIMINNRTVRFDFFDTNSDNWSLMNLNEWVATPEQRPDGGGTMIDYTLFTKSGVNSAGGNNDYRIKFT